MIRKYIIVADDSIKGFDEGIAKLEREWGAEEIEPSEDCISRQAVIDYAKDTCLDLDKYEDTEVFCDEIKAMPSVTPTSEDIKEAYLKGYDYGVKDWFKSKTQPCEDAVSREEAKQFLYERIDRLNDDELYDIFSRIIDDMYNELPSVIPQRPKGKWMVYAKVEFGDFKGTEKYKCSECGHEVGVFLSRYCPNCGAEMIFVV